MDNFKYVPQTLIQGNGVLGVTAESDKVIKRGTTETMTSCLSSVFTKQLPITLYSLFHNSFSFETTSGYRILKKKIKLNIF